MESDRYEITYSNKALSGIDRKRQGEIKKKIEAYLVNAPMLFAKKLKVQQFSSIGQYRWRIGKYRVFFNIDHKRREISITEVRIRKEAYQ